MLRIFAILPLVLTASNVLADDHAHFWFSNTNVMPTGPASLELVPKVGTQQTLYLWGRSATGKKLQNFSLHVVAEPGVDFIDGTYAVYNSHTLGVSRYEFVFDSLSIPALASLESAAGVAGGAPDTLLNLQGFSLFPGAAVRGVGPTCVAGEVGCFLATDGQPAWLLGGLTLNPVTVGAVAEIHLQIGDLGISHASVASGDYDHDGVVASGDRDLWSADFASMLVLAADGNANGEVDAADYTVYRDNLGAMGVVESAALTTVQFGANGATPEPVYNASTQRSMTLAADAADARITVVAATAVVATTVPEPSAVWVALTVAFALLLSRGAGLCVIKPRMIPTSNNAEASSAAQDDTSRDHSSSVFHTRGGDDLRLSEGDGWLTRHA